MSVAATRLVIFDCDGTLVDSQHVIVAAMDTAFRTHGLVPPTARSTRRTVGLPLAGAIASLLPEDSAHLLDKVVSAYKEVSHGLRQHPDHEEPLYPGVVDTLETFLSAGFVLGVATGKSRRGLQATLERHDLLGHFATLKTADDGPGKPNPDILLDAIIETGATPATAVMIGDTTFDILMAVQARTRSIGVSWGYHAPEELIATGAAHIAEQFAELPGAVAGIWEAKR